MECIQCKKQFNSERKTARFCSAKCRKLAFLNKEVSVPVSVPTPDRVSVPPAQMTRQQIEDAIHSYPQDTWKNSPEYAELGRRIDIMSIKELDGYYIPAYKLNENYIKERKGRPK